MSFLKFTAGRLGLAALLIAGCVMPTAGQSNTDPNQIKVAITYNVIRFVAFPGNGTSAPLVLCAGRGEAATNAFLALNGQRVGDRPLSVRTIDTNSAVPGSCNVAYLGTNYSGDAAKLHQQGTLIVGEGNEFAKSGGMIGLVNFGRQIRFEVNVRNARQSGVAISSKLLRLAVKVYS